MIKAKYKIALMPIITITMVFAVKLFLPEPENNIESGNEFWLRKTFVSATNDLVVGGDSRIYRGVSTVAINSVLEAELEAVNLGYSSAGFSSEYLDFLVDKLSIDGQRMLVLGLTPHSFTLEAAKNELYHQYKKTTNFELFKGLYLSKYLKYFAPYKATEIKEFITGGVSSEGYFQTFQEDGWVHSHKLPEDSLTAIEIYEKLFTDYQVSDSLIGIFFSRVSELSKEGVKILAFRPPTFGMMTQVEDSLSGYDEAFMRSEIVSRGGIWIDLDPTDFHTYDGSHLHYKSAEKLSKIIGTRIKRLLEAG